MDWNVDQIFEDNGGPNDLHARLQSEYPDLTVRAVRQWQRRQVIPLKWLARIMYVNNIQLPEGWVVTEMEDIF